MTSDNSSPKEFGNELDISRFIEAILIGIGKLSVAIGKTFRDFIVKPRKVELPTDIANISSLPNGYARPLTYLFLGLLAVSIGVALKAFSKFDFTDFLLIPVMITPLMGIISLHGVITSRVASKRRLIISSGFSIALSAYTAGTCAWLIVIFLPLFLIVPTEIVRGEATDNFYFVIVGGIILLGLILRLIYSYLIMLSQRLEVTMYTAVRIGFRCAIWALAITYGVLLWSIPIVSLF